ncbi:MAG: excinuclease ABC subunit UvrA [Anaerolineales bacterium]|nr:excinuclease ABC subunit UvrA [Anaerolineales bacterium]
MEPSDIIIRGAQQHNLKHIDVSIPRNKFVVLTGISGSGKSSLAFDTLYAEGQRRYVESLSSYARQFIGQMEKPKVDYIGGLSPAIAIEQKAISRNPRSTVGTVTDVMDYLRVLYARIGQPHCPQCGRSVQLQSAQQIADQLSELPAKKKFQLLAPVVRERKGAHVDVIEVARRDGFVRARIDGVPVELEEPIKLAKTKKHTIELIVDRLIIPDTDMQGEDRVNEAWAAFMVRLVDSVETTLHAGDGLLIADLGDGQELMMSEHNACPNCGISFPELTPQLFSFNSPLGMCPDCNGLGTQLNIDVGLIVKDPSLSLMEGALRWYGELRKKKKSWTLRQLRVLEEHYDVSLDTPWQDLPEKFRNVLLYGSGDERIRFTYEAEWDEGHWSGESVRTYEGVISTIERRFRDTKSDMTRRWYASFMSHQPCPTCEGARLRAEARGVLVGRKTISEVGEMTISEALQWVKSLFQADLGNNGRSHSRTTKVSKKHMAEFNNDGPETSLSAEEYQIAEEVLKEIRDRLQFMLNVGLHYLTLDRSAASLSGGEGQRIRLASQIGCGLVGVLYILDEPSIGLHARDNRALLDTLMQLRDMGNTVLVVEHDAETMRSADWIIDLGPGAGVLGGEVVSAGTFEQIVADPRSITGRYLSGELSVVAPNGRERREPKNGWLSIMGAKLHNLKGIKVSFPIGTMTCVTGVSGSGKSSLVAETLYPALARVLHNAQERAGPYERIEGLDHIDKVINITQSPIGRTPRSNPATYVKIFDLIRRVFANTVEAKARGYQSGRFSFNVKGGRCEACKGYGQKKIEMHFLADVWVRCQECKGSRYNRETLDIRFKGKNIAEVLDMDVQEALTFFANQPKIARVLQTLHDVGLDYVKLGQSATTLSGGEAQRVKLAKELGRVSTGRTLYILDEPTTGLHFADIQRLLDVLHRLVDAGNTVVVIEHNLDVVKTADWLIDLGPEGGEEGGMIVAQGTPEEVAGAEGSYTGSFLRKFL